MFLAVKKVCGFWSSLPDKPGDQNQSTSKSDLQSNPLSACVYQTRNTQVSFVALHHCLTRMWAMPNVMVALPNIGGTFCPTPQSLADAHY